MMFRSHHAANKNAKTAGKQQNTRGLRAIRDTNRNESRSRDDSQNAQCKPAIVDE